MYIYIYIVISYGMIWYNTPLSLFLSISLSIYLYLSLYIYVYYIALYIYIYRYILWYDMIQYILQETQPARPALPLPLLGRSTQIDSQLDRQVDTQVDRQIGRFRQIDRSIGAQIYVQRAPPSRSRVARPICVCGISACGLTIFF